MLHVKCKTKFHYYLTKKHQNIFDNSAVQLNYKLFIFIRIIFVFKKNYRSEHKNLEWF